MAVFVVWAESCRGGRPDTGGPYQLSVGGPAPVRIAPDGYQQYDFTLLRPGCTIAGNIAALAGGDFDAAVLDHDGFRRWRENQETHALWRTDRAATATVAVRFSEPGLYHLVVRSTYAMLTAKAVTLSVQARVECR